MTLTEEQQRQRLARQIMTFDSDDEDSDLAATWSLENTLERIIQADELARLSQGRGLGSMPSYLPGRRDVEEESLQNYDINRIMQTALNQERMMRDLELTRESWSGMTTRRRELDEPPPTYHEERYLREPIPRGEGGPSAAQGRISLASPWNQRRDASGPSTSSLLPPPRPPRYTRSPSSSADPSVSTWPRGSFPDGPAMALALDAAGGARTTQQLNTLETLMRKISSSMGYNSDTGLERTILKPCHVFHLIVGSGTGGLIAILLGRLEMSVQEVKDFYNRNEDYIFGPLKALKDVKTRLDPVLTDKIWATGEGLGVLPRSARTLATERLEEKLTWIIKIRNMGTELLHPRQSELGKVLVTAVHHEGVVSKTVKLRSYHCAGDDGPRPSILEAARATMAHISFFKPAKITGRSGGWTGAPTKYCNPIRLVLEEYPDFGNNNVVVSVGAGLPGESEAMSASKADMTGENQPATMTFDDVLDWSARVCAKIENINGRHRVDDERFRLRPVCLNNYYHFRLYGSNDENYARWAGSAIDKFRRECIKGEPGRRRVEEMEAEQRRTAEHTSAKASEESV